MLVLLLWVVFRCLINFFIFYILIYLLWYGISKLDLKKKKWKMVCFNGIGWEIGLGKVRKERGRCVYVFFCFVGVGVVYVE